jgi:hypothetical protein
MSGRRMLRAVSMPKASAIRSEGVLLISKKESSRVEFLSIGVVALM